MTKAMDGITLHSVLALVYFAAATVKLVSIGYKPLIPK